MAFRLGLDCKIYRNTGSYASPVWEEIENTRDVDYNLEHGEADLTTRGNNGWEAIVATLKRGSFEWGMVYDTADADFTALEAAWFAKTAVDFAFVDGDIAVPGTKGIRATCQLFGFGQNQALAEGVQVAVTAKPTYSVNAPTQWITPA
jgi:hypothetical protein